MAPSRPPSCSTPHFAMFTYPTLISLIFFCSLCIRPLTASPPSLPTPIITSSTPSKPPPAGPFTTDAIANFLKSRCGGSHDSNEASPAIWSYEGSLTDPMTGKVIAEVEGIELVKPLPMIQPSQLHDDNEQSILENLSAKNLLCPETDPKSSNEQWDSAVTILSRRLFCYRRPNTLNANPNNAPDSNTDTERFSPYNSLMTSLRLRPDGPLRHVSPLENIAVYDSAVTYISRNKGREMVVFSERGGRGDNAEDEGSTKHYVMGSAQSNPLGKGQSSSIFDFAVHSRRGTLNSRSDSGGQPMLPPLKLFSNGHEEVVISPPRSRFLQFGKGDAGGSPSERKYGSVRETYTYSFDHDGEGGGVIVSDQSKVGFFGRMKEQITGAKTAGKELSQLPPQCTLRYTRYGEAPPWYAPGRSCTLELRGKRIALPPSSDNLFNDKGDAANPLALSQHLPSLASWAASKCNFQSGWPSVFSNTDLMRQYYQLPKESETELANKAVELFCNENQLAIDSLDDYPTSEREQWLSYAENKLAKVQSCMKRLSKSFIVTELPRTSPNPDP